MADDHADDVPRENLRFASHNHTHSRGSSNYNEGAHAGGAGDLDCSPVDMWSSPMVVDGAYVTLDSPQREPILAAAREMAPIDE
ncbi:MAG: hypothetical protein WKF65_08400 [Gaiellaceae bacterium]